MTDSKSGTNKPIPIKDANKYHWWYDSKAAGVRNSPPVGIMGTSPTGSPPNAFNFMSTSPASTSGINPAIPVVKRRDSLKNMIHLCDFATP